MSERDGYNHGVPCWVDTAQPDPETAVGFYRELFGWEFEDTMPPGSPGRYFVARLGGADVAAVGSQPPEAPPTAMWNTYVCCDSADATVAAALDAGGTALMEPFDVLDAGRMALIADPSGATFCAWEAKEQRGAQRVNETGAWAMSTLSTGDPDRAEAFYGAVFGWETESFGSGEDTLTLFRVPGYAGGEPEQPVSREVVAAMRSPGDGSAPTWSVDFWVGDVDRAAGKTEELGGRVLAGPFATPVGRTAVLADPQGAAFSVSRVGPGA